MGSESIDDWVDVKSAPADSVDTVATSADDEEIVLVPETLEEFARMRVSLESDETADEDWDWDARDPVTDAAEGEEGDGEGTGGDGDSDSWDEEEEGEEEEEDANPDMDRRRGIPSNFTCSLKYSLHFSRVSAISLDDTILGLISFLNILSRRSMAIGCP